MGGICSLIALGGIAANSTAAVVGLPMLVSPDGGATWSTSVNSIPGADTVVGIFALHSASSYGFAGAVVRINGTGLVAGDFASISGSDSRIAPFNFGASSQAVFATPGAFRIDNAADAGNSSALGETIHAIPMPTRVCALGLCGRLSHAAGSGMTRRQAVIS